MEGIPNGALSDSQTELSAMDCNARGLTASCARRAVTSRPVSVLLFLLFIGLFFTGTLRGAESGEQILLLAFTSEGCPACRALEPLISGLEQKQYPLRRVSPQDPAGSALYDRFGIETMPSFVLLCGGVEQSRFISKGEDIQTVQTRLLSMFQSARSALAAAAPTKLPSPVVSPPAPASPVKTAGETNASADRNLFEKPFAATVRLRVAGGKNETDCGTGTLIHSSQTDQSREGLVLTCGHLFRDSRGDTPVQVDLFEPKTGKTVTVSGECVFYDDDLDIGFVGIPLPFEVEPARLAPPGYLPKQGDRLVSIGCSSGENPSLWEHTVKTTDRKYYQPKDFSKNQQFYFIEVSNAPRPGRSGGGLFARTADGETYLVGVCNAGDPQTDEGYFLPFSVVYDQLCAQPNLAFVYQELLRDRAESQNIQTVSFDSDSKSGTEQEKIRQTKFEHPSDNSQQVKLDELKECLAQGAEAICVVHWPKDAQGRERESEVIRVPRRKDSE